jgi:ATP-dependent Clp protease ATP-binding subunit ClpX
VKFGLIPELIGRIPVIVSLTDLDEEALVRIIREPKNSLIKQYTKLFEIDGVKITFEDDALRAIAHLAIERNTGARGLRSIMETMMQQTMFEVPSRDDIAEVVVTEDTVKNNTQPRYILKTEA